MKLKSLFRIIHKVGTILYYIIQNTIVSWIILSIFGVMPSKIFDFNASIDSIIFEHILFWLWKMFLIRIILSITIVIVARWIFIKEVSHMNQKIEKLPQLIISQLIPKKIVDIARHRCWSCYLRRIVGQYETIYDNIWSFMVSIFYFWIMYGWCVANLGLVPVAMFTFIS